MKLTPTAKARLEDLLGRAGKDVRGYRFEGTMGTCRGSTPVLTPTVNGQKGDAPVIADGVLFLVPPDQEALFEVAALDYDRSFMGRGLSMTWPHREGCQCQGNG